MPWVNLHFSARLCLHVQVTASAKARVTKLMEQKVKNRAVRPATFIQLLL